MTKEDLAFIRALRDKGVEVTFSEPPQLQRGEVENKVTPSVNSPVITEGTNIHMYQDFLSKIYPNEKIEVDGKWGPKTEALHKRFKLDKNKFKAEAEFRQDFREAMPLTGFGETFFPGATRTISALADDIFRKQTGIGEDYPVRTEYDFTEDQNKSIKAKTRQSLAEGRTFVTYPDWETLDPGKAYSNKTGIKTAKALLTDPNFQNQSILGNASIVITPETPILEPDTFLLDRYDFNESSYKNLSRDSNMTAGQKLLESFNQGSGPYAIARNVAQYFGSDEGDPSSKQYIIQINEDTPELQVGEVEAKVDNTAVFIPPINVEDIIAQAAAIKQIAENNRLASNYAKANPNSVVQQPINNSKIDYPSTDIRSANYSGNPNWAFAAPNMTGKQRADAEAYYGDIIGGELLGLGAERLANQAYNVGKQINRNKNLSKTLATSLDEATLNPDLIEGVLPKVQQIKEKSLASSDNLILDSKKIKTAQDDIAFTQKAKELQSKVPLTRVVDKNNLVVKDGKLFNNVEPYTVKTKSGLSNTTVNRNTSHWSYGHVGDPGHGSWKGKSTAIVSDYETLSKKGYALDFDPTDTFFYNSKNMEIPEGSLILTRDKKLYDDIIKNTNQKNVKYYPNTTNDEFESIVNLYGKKEGDESGKDLFKRYLEKNWKEGKDVAVYKPASNYKPVIKNVYDEKTGMYYQVEDPVLKTIGSPFGGGSSKIHGNTPLHTIERSGNSRLSKDVFDLYPDSDEFKDLLRYPKEIQLAELEKYKSLKRRKPGSKSIAELENAMAKNSGFNSYADFKKNVGLPQHQAGAVEGVTPELQEGLVESKTDNTATSLNLIPDDMFTPLTQQEINQNIQKEQQQAYQESLKQAKKEIGKEFVQQSMEDIQDHPLWTLPASLSPLGAEEILTTQALKQGKKLATPLSNTAKKAYKGITEYIPDEWGFTGQPLPEDLQKTSNELFSMLDTPRGRMRLKGNYGLSDDQIENLFAVEEQLSSGTLADFTEGMISINPNLPKGVQRTAWRHELEHAARWAQGLDYNKPISEMYIDQLKLIDPEIPSGYVASDVIKKGKQVDTSNWQEIFTDLPSAREYIKKPEEAGSFAAEVKQYMLDKGLAKSSFDKFTPEMVEQAYNMYQADKSIPLRLFDLLDPTASKSNYDKMARAFNRMMAITGAGSTAAIASQQAPELKQGGMERQKFSKEDLSFMRALRDRGVEVTFSSEGYRDDSPDRNNSVNMIDTKGTGRISMNNNDGTPIRGVKGVMGKDEYGNTKFMRPGGEYQFPGNIVTEVPLLQDGTGNEGQLELYGGSQNSLVGTATPVEGTMFGGSGFGSSQGYSAPTNQTYTMDPMQTGNMTASDTTGGDPMTGGSDLGVGFNTSTLMSIGSGLSNIGKSLSALGPESTTEVGSVSGLGGSIDQATEGTIGGTLSAIPIVGQFYQIGSGIGTGFEAGANALYAKGNTVGGEAMTAMQGAFDPASQWGRNFELWEAGYLSDEEMALNFVGGFFGFGGGPLMDRRVRQITDRKYKGAMTRATGGMHIAGTPSAESAGKFSRATGYPKPKRT